VAEINSRLDQRLRLLTSRSRTTVPRHQTLRASINWSYELLAPSERLLFERLSVFAGGWMLDAAESITAGGGIEAGEVLDLLTGLVEKSLVQSDEEDGTTRYGLLETIREFAAERHALQGGHERSVVRRAHRDHYLALVETAATHIQGPDQLGWLDRLEVEFDNIRAALALSADDRDSADRGLRFAVGLRWFNDVRGHSREVLAALTDLLERPDVRHPTLLRAKALIVNCRLLDQSHGSSTRYRESAHEAVDIGHALGDDGVTADALGQVAWLNYREGNLPAALQRLEEAVALARSSGDPNVIGRTISHRAIMHSELGDAEAALTDYAEAIAILRATGDGTRLASVLTNFSADRLKAGELTAARTHLEKAEALARDLRLTVLSPILANILGLVDIIEGDPSGARQHFIDSMTASRLAGTTDAIPEALLGLALAASAEGDDQAAASLHGATDEHLERAGRPLDSLEAGLRASDQAHLRSTVGDAAFNAAHQRGRSLTQAEAVTLATAHP
jgi:tetratricopeptide (TPR) repeat protein